MATLTGQFADKPTRGQSSHGLVNSPTANFFKSRKDCNTLYTMQKPNTNSNPINY